MKSSTKTILLIAGGLVVLTALTKKANASSFTGELSQDIGSSIGQTAAETIVNATAGIAQGYWSSLINTGEAWADDVYFNIEHYGNPFGIGFYHD